jgi:hypothetical protein
MIETLNSFDQSVLRRGVDTQSPADLTDGLMVSRVDCQGLLLDDLPEAGPRMNFYRMAGFASLGSLFVLVGVRKLRRDILIKRPAQGDIDRLRAAANSQKR